VDKSNEAVTIKKRFLWLFSRTRIIPFGRIKKIDYSYRSVPISWDIWIGARERSERYTVSLELISPPETVVLFSFFGFESEGLIFYFKGSQDEPSRSYIDLLKDFTDKTLV